jgi:hypothetical protein
MRINIKNIIPPVETRGSKPKLTAYEKIDCLAIVEIK